MKISNRQVIIFVGVGILMLTFGFVVIAMKKTNTTKNQINTNRVIVGCEVAGCSGQLCVEAKNRDIMTTCEWKEEYACYKKAKCERQTDGKCGFTKGPEFRECIEGLRQKF
jgi:eight-cysteine-cluster-containing protein